MRVLIDKVPVDVLVLSSQKDQAQGFMGTKEAPAYGTGLLFVYPEAKSGLSFWMKDVGFDLELLAFDKNGILTQVTTLRAGDHTPVSLKGAVQAVLETKPGFAKSAKLQIGASLLRFDA
jgi:uncharacterized membrane protein (UPF0127 family)